MQSYVAMYRYPDVVFRESSVVVFVSNNLMMMAVWAGPLSGHRSISLDLMHRGTGTRDSGKSQIYLEL
jgi:hypothetical protein